MRTLVLSLIAARLLFGLWSGASKAVPARQAAKAHPEVVYRR